MVIECKEITFNKRYCILLHGHKKNIIGPFQSRKHAKIKEHRILAYLLKWHISAFSRLGKATRTFALSKRNKNGDKDGAAVRINGNTHGFADEL